MPSLMTHLGVEGVAGRLQLALAARRLFLAALELLAHLAPLGVLCGVLGLTRLLHARQLVQRLARVRIRQHLVRALHPVELQLRRCRIIPMCVSSYPSALASASASPLAVADRTSSPRSQQRTRTLLELGVRLLVGMTVQRAFAVSLRRPTWRSALGFSRGRIVALLSELSVRTHLADLCIGGRLAVL
jgi:hypothetical protein